MPKKIFISYARPDRDVAEAIAQTLKSLEYDVWWDHSLLPAENFRSEITRNLEAADFVFVLWSPSSVSSQWVLDEAERGARQKRLVPIALAGFAPESVPIGLNQQQLVFCADSSIAVSEQFKRQVVEAITVLGLGTRSVVRNVGSGEKRGRGGLIALVGGALVVAVAVAVFGRIPHDEYVECKGEYMQTGMPGWIQFSSPVEASASMRIGRWKRPELAEASGSFSLYKIFSACEGRPLECKAQNGGAFIQLVQTVRGADGLNFEALARIQRSSGRYYVIEQTSIGDDVVLRGAENGTCAFRWAI
ncbi:MAG: toll/interleukin-1 receptor domain-containing protein [Hyphomonadaceae bacterium]|nr:toll/interleukin-1 receptor domain-containing protein [Hyphomonadaceae bacterium]